MEDEVKTKYYIVVNDVGRKHGHYGICVGIHTDRKVAMWDASKRGPGTRLIISGIKVTKGQMITKERI